MNAQPKVVEVLRQFQGLHSDFDPSDVPPQAFLRLSNMMQVKNGELTTRGGLVELETEELE